MKPQSSNIKNIAPVEIVKNYEAFLKAIKDGDFLLARESIDNMKTYQGGEKLAQELWDEFFPMLQNTLEEAEGEQDRLIKEEEALENYDAEKELIAQKILIHSDSFQTFLEDKNYVLAQEELAEIKRLGDKSLAMYLENKLLELKKTENRKREIDQENLKINAARLAEDKKAQESEKLKNIILGYLPKDLALAKRRLKTSEKKLIKKHAQEIQAYIEKQQKQEWESKKQHWEDVFFLALHEERVKDAENAARRLSLLKVKSSTFWSLLKDLKITLQKRENEKIHNAFYSLVESEKIQDAKNFLAQVSLLGKKEKKVMELCIQSKECEKKEREVAERNKLLEMKEKKKQKESQKKLQRLESLFYVAIDEEDEKQAGLIINKLSKEGVNSNAYKKVLEKMLERQKEDLRKKQIQEKNEKVLEFYRAVKEARFRYAKNFLEKMPLGQNKKNNLAKALSKEEKLHKEAKRKKGIADLFAELQEILKNKDFKSAKSVLTKLKRISDNNEYNRAKVLYDNAFQDEQKNIEVCLYEAICKNIEEEKLSMAQSNLKDYKKIGAFEKYHELKKKLGQKKGELQWKENFIGHEDIKKKEEVLDIVNKVSKLLKESKFDEADELLKKLKNLGDSNLVRYWKKYFEELRGMQNKEMHELEIHSQRKLWREKFEEVLLSQSSEGISQLEKLLLEAEKLYSVLEVQEFKKQADDYLIYLEVQKFISKHDFSAAYTFIQNLNDEIWKKEEYFLFLSNAETQYEEYELQKGLQNIKENIQKKKEEGDFDSALELSEKLIGLEKSSEYLRVKKELQKEQAQQEEKDRLVQVESLIGDIELGNFQRYEAQKNQLSSKDLIRVEKACAEYHKKKLEDERKGLFSELLHKLEEERSLDYQEKIFMELKRIAIGDEYQQIHKAFEDLKLEERRLNSEKLVQLGGGQLHEFQFQNVRETAHQLLQLGALKESEQLLVHCLEREAVFQKELFIKDIPALHAHIRKTFKSHKYEKIKDLSHLIIEKKSLLKSTEGLKIFKIVTGFIEKEIERSIQIESFLEAEKLMLLLKSFSSDSASKLEKVLRKQKEMSSKKRLIDGMESLRKKQKVLYYYQSWKNAYDNKLSSEIYTENIKELGEKQFAYFLLNYDEYLETERRGFKQSEDEKRGLKIIKNSLASGSYEFLKKSLPQVFYSCSNFSVLRELSLHYSKFLKIEKEKSFAGAEERLNREITTLLEKEKIIEAQQLLSQNLFQSLSLSPALKFADLILLEEKRIHELEINEKQKSFMLSLSSSEMKKASEQVSCLSPSQVLEAIKTLRAEDSSNNAESLHQKLDTLKGSIESLLKEQKISEAWKLYEKDFPQISYGIYDQSRFDSSEQIFLAFQGAMETVKQSVKDHISEENYSTAQEILKSLHQNTEEIQEKISVSQKSELCLKKTFYSFSALISSGDVRRAEDFLIASESSLSAHQLKYFRSLLNEHKKLLNNSKKESLINFLKEKIRKHDFESLSPELNELKKIDVLDYFYIKSVLEDERKKSIHLKAEKSKAILKDLLIKDIQEENMDAALKNLHIEKIGLKNYIECYFFFHEKQLALVNNKLQQDCQSLFLSIKKGEENIGRQINLLEERCLQLLLDLGETWWIKDLEKIYECLLKKRNIEQIISFDLLLKNHCYDQAHKLIEKVSPKRLELFLFKELGLKEYQYNRKGWSKSIDSIKRFIKGCKLDKARESLNSIGDIFSAYDYRDCCVKLLETEIKYEDKQRTLEVERLKKVIIKNLDIAEFEKAEALLEDSLKMSYDDEKKSFRDWYEKKKIMAQSHYKKQIEKEVRELIKNKQYQKAEDLLEKLS